MSGALRIVEPFVQFLGEQKLVRASEAWHGINGKGKGKGKDGENYEVKKVVSAVGRYEIWEREKMGKIKKEQLERTYN